MGFIINDNGKEKRKMDERKKTVPLVDNFTVKYNKRK